MRSYTATLLIRNCSSLYTSTFFIMHYASERRSKTLEGHRLLYSWKIDVIFQSAGNLSIDSDLTKYHRQRPAREAKKYFWILQKLFCLSCTKKNDNLLYITLYEELCFSGSLLRGVDRRHLELKHDEPWLDSFDWRHYYTLSSTNRHFSLEKYQFIE